MGLPMKPTGLRPPQVLGHHLLSGTPLLTGRIPRGGSSTAIHTRWPRRLWGASAGLLLGGGGVPVFSAPASPISLETGTSPGAGLQRWAGSRLGPELSRGAGRGQALGSQFVLDA